MSNILNKPAQELMLTAFNELSVAEDTPLFQITAQYGLRDDVLQINIGGTTTSSDANFIASTGTGANNVSAIVSRREAQYKSGQGLKAKFTALFTQGVASSTQQAGFITSESAFCFGYNGTEFGILYAKNGLLEDQELQITTPASGAENATVTVDGTAYVIPITAGTVQQNAYTIATYLSANAPGYNFTSNNDIVYALALLPDFGAGSFAFSSATAVATWTQITNGLLPTETWVKQADWNVNPTIQLDPTLGNVYQIQIQYLGYGGITFWAEDPLTSKLEIVHIIHYSSTATVPSVSNPIFRVGWAARNTGNTTNLTVKGASAGAFIEGKGVIDALSRGVSATTTAVGTTRTNILAIRNRLTFFGRANRAEVLLQAIYLTTDTGKTAIFDIVERPILSAGFLSFSYVDSVNSLLETATNKVTVSGGNVIASFAVKATGSFQVDVSKIIKLIRPGITYSIASRVTSSAASEMDCTVIWKDDL